MILQVKTNIKSKAKEEREKKMPGVQFDPGAVLDKVTSDVS